MSYSPMRVLAEHDAAAAAAAAVNDEID